MRRARTDEEILEMIEDLDRLASDKPGLPISSRLSDQASILRLAYEDSCDRASALKSAIELYRGKSDDRQFDLIHALEWGLGLAENLVTPDGLRLPKEGAP